MAGEQAGEGKPNDLDLVILESDSTTSCKIHLFGATVISWFCQGEEYIFVSSKSKFDNKSPIRGGIPVVFPNFGPWSLGPQHGFARSSRWTVEHAPTKNENGDVTAVLSLEDSDETRRMWNNNKFKLVYTVVLGERSLRTSLNIENRGSESFSFTCLLHTYFHVPDISAVRISNINGLSYTDKVKGGEKLIESRNELTISANVDSVYEKTPNEHRISGVTGGRTLLLSKENFPDTVMWNPWKEKAAQMADLGDDDYKLMVCVEAGHVTSPVVLPPAGVYHASQTMTILH